LSLASLLTDVTRSLARAGVSSPRAEAEILAGHVLGLRRFDLYARARESVGPDDESTILELARRREERYPLQYLTGECEFMSLAFAVREGVFIPRPETEVLVESVVARLRPGGGGPAAVLEVGVGSGVICVSLARAVPGVRVVGTDVSALAVKTARENAARHGVENLMQFIVGDGISFLRERGRRGARKGMGFDAFVCNPPYVRSSEIENLEPEVRDHEPLAALDGGADGLDFLRRIIPPLPSIMSKGALVAFEIAPGQSGAARRLLEVAGALEIDVIKDLSSRDRVLIARMA
jgi:release factor glutamine methyltransferase